MQSKKSMQKSVTWFFLLLFAVTIFCSTELYADIPLTLNYQGYLSDSSGSPVGDTEPADLSILFSLYNSASAATPLWSETQVVTVTEGVFDTMLNISTASPPLDFTETYYLGIKVGDDEEMAPRQVLSSVAYSFRAEYANNVKPSGVTTSALEDSAVTSAKIADNSILATDIATGAVSSTKISTAAITASHISASAVGSSQIATGAVTSGKISVPLTLSGSAQYSPIIHATNTSSQNGWGLYGEVYGENSLAVYGKASNPNDVDNYGGYFIAEGEGGRGVYGRASNSASTRETYGGYFSAAGLYGRGVYGTVNGQYGQGITGYASGINGRGVYGEATNTGSVDNFGGLFRALGANGYGVYGVAGGVNAYAGYFEGDVHVNGTFSSTVKSFIHPHPNDPTKEIVYVSLEGGENGVYVRGSGQLVNGKAEIILPEHFALVAADTSLTSHITPKDGKAKSYLFVDSLSPRKMMVLEANNGNSNARFDYLVNAVRRGFEEHEVIRENTRMKPASALAQEEYEERLALPKNSSLRQLLIENSTLSANGKIRQDTKERLGWSFASEKEKMPSHDLEPADVTKNPLHQ